jgi:hypothetical protein
MNAGPVPWIAITQLVQHSRPHQDIAIGPQLADLATQDLDRAGI